MADPKNDQEETRKAPTPGATQEPPAGADGAARLEQELAKRTEEAAANHDRYVRAVADAENLKKRLQREKSDAIRYANESLLRDLLQVIDSLELAIEHADPEGSDKSLVEGLQLTLRLFRDVLQRHGVKEIEDPTGKPFDPSTQEAAAVERAQRTAPNAVIRQQSKGYVYNDRLLRPARVVVAATSSDEPNPDTVH